MFVPQQLKPPAEVMEHVVVRPAEICTMPDDNPMTSPMKPTLTAVRCPTPNCPEVFNPQHLTAPALVNTHECSEPRASADAAAPNATAVGVDVG
jgi:hypothetical protein